jgi:hypothetical protein
VPATLPSNEGGSGEDRKEFSVSSWQTISSQPFALPECKYMELTSTLTGFRFPIAIADDLASGKSWSSSISTRMGHLAAAFRAVPWLRAYTRAIYRTASLSGSYREKVARFELQRERFRGLCLEYIASESAPTRAMFRETRKTAYIWLQRHDTCWFKVHLPPRRHINYATPKTREESRAEILALIAAHPHASRSELWRRALTVVTWANARDFDWVQTVFPPRRLARSAKSKGVLQIIEAPPH